LVFANLAAETCLHFVVINIQFYYIATDGHVALGKQMDLFPCFGDVQLYCIAAYGHMAFRETDGLVSMFW
jgi:hypothetical protein